MKEKHWFTYEFINKNILSAKSKGYEAADRPALINVQSGKLIGHAVQTWVFLRFLPILIGNEIVDTGDKIWALVLLLREIVELICSPKISMRQIAIMKDRTEEYLQSRFTEFPNEPLKPKHHFISHYPELTIKCGPLIRLMTLRFESKHSFFKRCARSSQNFINICHSLAVKHSLLQSYYSTGSLFSENIYLESPVSFNADCYDIYVQAAISEIQELINDHSLKVSRSAFVNGHSFVKDVHLVYLKEDYTLFSVEVKYIFESSNSKIYFVGIKNNVNIFARYGYLFCSKQFKCLGLCSP